MSDECRFTKELDRLRTLRDELRLHAHLGAAEVRDLWQTAEEKFRHLEARTRKLGTRVQAEAEELSQELTELYGKIRGKLDTLRSR